MIFRRFKKLQMNISTNRFFLKSNFFIRYRFEMLQKYNVNILNSNRKNNVHIVEILLDKPQTAFHFFGTKEIK